MRPIEKKIIIINEDNKEIGRTYQKRARQLVKKNRATWIETNKICLANYMEDNEMEKLDNPIPNKQEHSKLSEGYRIVDRIESNVYNISPIYTNEELFELAKTRVEERRKVLMHIGLYIVSFLFSQNAYGRFISQILYVVLLLWLIGLSVHVLSYLTAVTPEKVERQYKKLKSFEDRRKYK